MNQPPEVEGATQREVQISTRDAGPLRVHLYEAGEGPPVILLHGWPQHAWCWRGVIGPLSAHHRVIAPDLRGFGWSDAPGRGYDPLTFGRDAVALMDALEIESACVGGHDWGGAAVFTMALEHPDRVEKVLAANTIPPWINRSPAVLKEAWKTWYAVGLAAAGSWFVSRRPRRLAGAIRADVVHEERLPQEVALAYTLPLSRPASADATQKLYRAYLRIAFGRGPSTEGLASLRLTQPTRFLFGTNDGAIPRALLDGVEDHADDLTMEWVEDSGHFICDEKPELVAERARALFAD
jgi:pimeloyl-ACP methyl ester carboxylesterase